MTLEANNEPRHCGDPTSISTRLISMDVSRLNQAHHETQQQIRMWSHQSSVDNEFPVRQPTACERSRWLAVFTVLLCTIVWVVSDLRKSEDSVVYQADLKFVAWLEHHPGLGVLAVVLVYIVATICFVPGSLLTIGTSFAFGRAFDSTIYATLLSSVAVFTGASLGSISCLLLGRYLFREPVERMARSYPIIMAFDRAMQNNGFYIMLLLRLSPLVPYNALDFLSGVTSISLYDYTLAMIGLLPGTIAFCFIGATASDVSEGKLDDLQAIVAITIGLVFAFASISMASYYSKIELEKILEERQNNSQGRPSQRYLSLQHDADDSVEDSIESKFDGV